MGRLHRIAVALMLPWVAGSLAAQTGDPGGAPFGEVLDVRVVNVEVVVTDRDGVPVHGLAVEDFELLVDGAPEPIDYFSEIRSGQVRDWPGSRSGSPVPGLPALTPGDPVGTSYLLFIDDFFSLEGDRRLLLEAVRADLPLLGPADRMAIVAFDGRSLEMLSSWSGSVPRLERALAEAGRRPALGLQRVAERRRWLGRTRSSLPSLQALNTTLSPETQAYALRLGDQVARMVAGAAATLRSFARPPGRRVMLLLSGGWPFRPLDSLLGNPAGFVIDDLEIVQGMELFEPLVDTANRVGYTLYPVDLPGLRAAGFEDPGATAAIPGGASGLEYRTASPASLRHLARETGGEAILGSGRSAPLRRAVSDTRSYYWLGFTPERAWDDRRHRIEVRVANPDLRVRTRRDYLDVSPQTEVGMALESALLFDSPTTAGELGVEAGEPRKGGFRKMLVPLTLRIPTDRLTFLPREEGEVAAVELRIAVYDETFHSAPIPVIPLVIERREAVAAGGEVEFQTTLKLRRRPHQAIVAVFDPPSGRILSARVELSP